MEKAINNIVNVAGEVYHKVRIDTAQTVIDRVVAFMNEKIEVDEELAGYFNEFREVILGEMQKEAEAITKKANTGDPKKKDKKKDKIKNKEELMNKPLKPLTLNNLFIQDKMAELKAAGVKGDAEKGNILKQANEFWKAMSEDEKSSWIAANRERLDAINKDRAENPAKYRSYGKKE